MLYSFRKDVKNILLFIAGKINFPFLTPNILTLLSIPFALAAAYYIYYQNFSVAIIFMAIAFFIDALDGPLAEIQKRKTLFGNYLDAMVDRVVEGTIFVGLAFIFPISAILALWFSLLVSYSKARVGLVIPADNKDWPSFGGRPERLLLLFAGMLAAIFFPSLAGFSTMEIALYLVAIISLVGFVQRIFFAKKMIKEKMRK